MADSEETLRQQDFIRAFGRFVVGFGWFDHTGERGKANAGRGELISTSAFVVSICDTWFLVTAGHILEDIRVARANQQILSGFHLDDGWGTAVAHPPFGFDFDNTKKVHFFNEHRGEDYGAIRLRDNTRSLLQANDVKALDESMWSVDAAAKFDEYVIVGIPAQFCRAAPVGGGVLQTTSLALFILKELDDPPEELKKPLPRFFGRVVHELMDDEGTPLSNLDGMSGCPIFGFVKVEGGVKVWLVAIQSKQNCTRTIAIGCRFTSFGKYLESRLREGSL